MSRRNQIIALVLASTMCACTLPDPEPRTNGESPAGAGGSGSGNATGWPSARANAPDGTTPGTADLPSGGASSESRAVGLGGGPTAGGSNDGSGGASESGSNDSPSDVAKDVSGETLGGPSSDVPSIPSGDSPSAPSGDSPSVPSSDSPSVPSSDAPTVPSSDSPISPVETVVVTPPPPPSTWYDLTTGLGFAAKGDVQSAFGWNDEGLTNAVCSAVMGSNHDCAELFVPQNLHVWFTLEAHDIYRATCEFTTGPSETVHDITIPRHTFIDSDVASTARASGAKAITGFNLKGPSFTQLGKKIPVVGEPCVGENGNAQNGTWKTVELVESNGGLGLWVHTDMPARASDVSLWQY
jgi:hypothetical protein